MSTADVKRDILSFPNGSSGGPDRFYPQHLKDLIRETGETSAALLDALTNSSTELF